MSLEILGKVKEFLTKIVKDENFRTELTNKTRDEVKKVMADGGYNFSKEEFETAALQILELKEQGEFHELTEEELVGAVGGLTKLTIIDAVPMYGIPPIWDIWNPIIEEYPKPKEEEPKPCKPWMCYQAMYGASISDLELM
ncbi:MAG: Nif11-like leader peptide family natural product precursor [Nostocaceae cyanobacterium]|nr:Nif11-like leader peptide family natural product precursor [Nostocaceae cyanobacterium]